MPRSAGASHAPRRRGRAGNQNGKSMADTGTQGVTREQHQELLQRLERYEQQLRRMELINEIAEAANNTSDPPQAVRHALARICRSTGWPVGHAFFVETSYERIELVSSRIWHVSEPHSFDEFIQFTEGLRLNPTEGFPGVVYCDKEALWTNAMRGDALRFAMARKVGLQSGFAFPVMIGNEVTAVLEFFSAHNLAPDEIVLDIVSQLGIILGRVFERRRASNEREALNEKLIRASRRAGMAEVASGVLHNVGNVLNSITVSSTLLQDRLRQSNIDGVERIAELLGGHSGDLADFLTGTEKGAKVLPYLCELGKALKSERAGMLEELESLMNNIEHIKNVVRRQQYYARPASVYESVQAEELIEDSLKINGLDDAERRIHIERRYSDLPPLYLDKHNVIQILNNLISNAKQALDGQSDHPRIVVATGAEPDKRTVYMRVSDNGCGIPEELQHRLFQFGFTTKENGHGFGLHTSATAAQSLGGNLTFASNGPGRGTTFTLTLPFTPDTSTAGGAAA